jgi:hypothetical protein
VSYGRILAAGIEIDGDELQSDHDATDTVLDVEHALDFYEPDYGETIQVRVVAEDGTEELATIKVPETEDEDTVDDEEGFITLSAGLVNAYPQARAWRSTRRHRDSSRRCAWTTLRKTRRRSTRWSTTPSISSSPRALI